MSKSSNNIKSTEEIMDSLKGIRKASPGFYFFTRVKARLEKGAEENTRRAPRPIFARPAFVIAALCLILIIDGLFFLHQQQDTSVASTVDQNEQTTLANEYSLATNNIYDDESNEP